MKEWGMGSDFGYEKLFYRLGAKIYKKEVKG
jgi:hypothetical protein